MFPVCPPMPLAARTAPGGQPQQAASVSVATVAAAGATSTTGVRALPKGGANLAPTADAAGGRRGGRSAGEGPKHADRSNTWAGKRWISLRHRGVKLIGKSLARSSQGNYASGSRSWESFCGLIDGETLRDARASQDEMTWALINFAAWCLDSGNRVAAGVEIDTCSPLICALRRIARSHSEAGTGRRVRLPVTLGMLLDGECLIPSWEW